MAEDSAQVKDWSIAEPNDQALDNANRTTRKRRKPQSTQPKPSQMQFSIRRPTWRYIHLQHLWPSSSSNRDLDAVTAHLHLTSALSSFLGLHGTAISLDILKLEGSDVWVRVPATDGAAVLAAVGGWAKAGTGEGWRVKGWSAWDAGARGRDGGQDLFE